MTATVTPEELQEHRNRDDVWIAIHGKVYNVTDFLDKHPGGVEVLLEQAGMDASVAFEDIGHSDHARELLEELRVADLAGRPQENLMPTPLVHQEPAITASDVCLNGALVAASIAVAAVLGGLFAYHYYR